MCVCVYVKRAETCMFWTILKWVGGPLQVTLEGGDGGGGTTPEDP